VYFTEEATTEWHPPKTGSRGSPQKYSVLAIEASLIIRQVFHLPLRQTQGFMYSLITALGIDITIPDFSSLSKRSVALPRHKLTKELARIFGNTMKARKLPQQKAEAWASAVALNRMTGLGMPASVKI
jgi:hypothetical protein